MKIIPKLGAIVLLLGLASCAGPLGRPAGIFLDEVGAEYVAYVEADASLDADEKQIRLQHVASFKRAVDEANK